MNAKLVRVSILAFVVVAIAAGLLALTACGPQEKPYPSGPIKIIIARGAGGSNDQIGRLVIPYLQKELGVPIVVENIPGGGGVEGTEAVFKAKPDGYTMLFGATTTDITKQVGEGTPYDYMKFTPIYNIGGKDSNLIMVNANSPIKTFADFVNTAKTKGVSLAKTTGVSTSSIGLAWLVNIAGIPKEKINPVPFEDGKSQALAVAGGHVDAGISQASSIMSLVKDGKLRVILNFGKERNSLFPDVASFVELYPGPNNYYEFYQGFMGPPNMPPAVVNKLNEALDKVVQDVEFKDKCKALFTLVPMRGEKYAVELAAYYKTANDMKPMLTMFEIR